MGLRISEMMWFQTLDQSHNHPFFSWKFLSFQVFFVPFAECLASITQKDAPWAQCASILRSPNFIVLVAWKMSFWRFHSSPPKSQTDFRRKKANHINLKGARQNKSLQAELRWKIIPGVAPTARRQPNSRRIMHLQWLGEILEKQAPNQAYISLRMFDSGRIQRILQP